ncbi:S-adenosylmethionine-dependent methyltransferase Rv2258c-like [Amphiura filiformis]|uniref:S-adenosylmethionine-dependent methyltransferase Rv2258c-like n=1 Tax=Amphiura filiformis TaxID=82378 RepID=UPI003B20D584
MASRDETTEDFSSKMADIVMGGYVCLALALGNRAGLWDIMCTFDEPKTSKEIADAAGLKPKFVKEWLGAVVAPGIVDLDSSGEKFFLPMHRRNALTEGTPGATNYTEYACGLPVLMKDFDQMPTAMKVGGKGITGLSWDDECPGWAWYQHLSVDFMQSHMVNGVVPTNKGLREQLEKGISVLEVGCDVGTATNVIAENFPNSNVIGIDINDEALKKARADAQLKKLKNVCYDIQDIYNLPSEWSDKFDHVYTIDTIHGLRPRGSLKGIFRSLKPNGTLNLIELKGNAKMVDNKDLVNAPYLYMSNLIMNMEDHDHGHGDEDDHSHDQHDHSHDKPDQSHDHGHEEKKSKDNECEHTESSDIRDDYGQDSELRPCGDGPGWWWGKDNIFKAVKEAGFKSAEEHKIPGSYTHVVYVCTK